MECGAHAPPLRSQPHSPAPSSSPPNSTRSIGPTPNAPPHSRSPPAANLLCFPPPRGISLARNKCAVSFPFLQSLSASLHLSSPLPNQSPNPATTSSPGPATAPCKPKIFSPSSTPILPLQHTAISSPRSLQTRPLSASITRNTPCPKATCSSPTTTTRAAPLSSTSTIRSIHRSPLHSPTWPATCTRIPISAFPTATSSS